MLDLVKRTVVWRYDTFIHLSVNVTCKPSESDENIMKIAKHTIISVLGKAIEDDFLEYLDNLGDWSIVEQ